MKGAVWHVQRQTDTREPVDYVLLILVLILAVFGLVVLYSTSAYNGRVKFADSAYYLRKQFCDQPWTDGHVSGVSG